MLRILTVLTSFVMMSTLVLGQEPAPKEILAQTLDVKCREQGGEVSVAISGSIVMEGTIVFDKVRDDKWFVRAWARSESGDPTFVKTAIDPPKVTLSGASLPVTSVDDGGKGFKDPGNRQWTLTKGDNVLLPTKPDREGGDPPPLRLKGTTVWSKDSPNSLVFTDDSGRTWRYVTPKEEEEKEESKQ
jgi:hypothetical protein